MTNSEILDEILHECYKLGIIDDIRKKVEILLNKNPKLELYEAYYFAYQEFMKNN